MGLEGKISRMIPRAEFTYFFTDIDEQKIVESVENVETIMENHEKIKI